MWIITHRGQMELQIFHCLANISERERVSEREREEPIEAARSCVEQFSIISNKLILEYNCSPELHRLPPSI